MTKKTLAPRIATINKESIHSLAHEVLNNIGEGIIMRSPLSEYVSGRSNFLLKYKVFNLFIHS